MPYVRYDRVSVLFLLLSSCAAIAAAQSSSPADGMSARATAPPPAAALALPRGEVVPEITSTADPSQSFALYLPSAYAPDRTWPVLLVMDPRGRAVHALDLFRHAAERFGWVVLSSYGTRSDTNEDPNTPAIKAMLADAQTRWSVDTRRIYLTGMSGTAKVSWPFGRMLEGNVAGVIGVGGGLPPDMPLGDSVPFAFHGLAGTHDFNYREMRDLDASLGEIGAVHRFAAFDGPHGWAPAEVCEDAVAWMELMAMRHGLIDERAAFVDARLAAERRAAATLRRVDSLQAYRRYDQITRDFDGLRDTAADRAAADALDRDAEVRAARKSEKKLLAAERAYRDLIQRWLDRMAAAPKPLPTDRSLSDLQIAKLRETAAGDDRRAAQSAQRRLETAFVQTGFYLPQAYRARDRLDRALAVLEVATEIKPEVARSYWQIASLHAELGHIDQAFAALEQAFERSKVDYERLRTDPQWHPLHDDPRWTKLFADSPSAP